MRKLCESIWRSKILSVMKRFHIWKIGVYLNVLLQIDDFMSFSYQMYFCRSLSSITLKVIYVRDLNYTSYRDLYLAQPILITEYENILFMEALQKTGI